MSFSGKYKMPAGDTVNYRVVGYALRNQVSDDQVWLGNGKVTSDY